MGAIAKIKEGAEKALSPKPTRDQKVEQHAAMRARHADASPGRGPRGVGLEHLAQRLVTQFQLLPGGAVEADAARQPVHRQSRRSDQLGERTADDAQQRAWLGELSKLNYGVSPVTDCKYFHSIYYREPGNILFEIATDPPGFAIDEAPEKLGSHLVLPAWLEPQRAQLEAVLPPLVMPDIAVEVTQ